MGLNDLEGSVLLEAEDYRRIAQEVKALKTTVLKQCYTAEYIKLYYSRIQVLYN